ncbi:hypothetical protein ACFXIV_47935, partial [Nocardia sp. NPDC059236]
MSRTPLLDREFVATLVKGSDKGGWTYLVWPEWRGRRTGLDPQSQPARANPSSRRVMADPHRPVAVRIIDADIAIAGTRDGRVVRRLERYQLITALTDPRRYRAALVELYHQRWCATWL